MTERKEINYSDKQFLSASTKEYGNIAWYIVRHDRGPSDKWIESEIRLADCSRSVSFNMSLSLACDSFTAEEHRQQMQERLDKIDTLIAQLTQFREKYAEAISG